MAAVDAYVPDGVPGFEAFFRRPPFDGIDPAEQMLTGCGYRQVDMVTVEVETVYASPEQWWAACQSQGPWAISWRHIPPAQLEMALTRTFTLLEAVRGRMGASPAPSPWRSRPLPGRRPPRADTAARRHFPLTLPRARPRPARPFSGDYR
jgi:hypothetical protein